MFEVVNRLYYQQCTATFTLLLKICHFWYLIETSETRNFEGKVHMPKKSIFSYCTIFLLVPRPLWIYVLDSQKVSLLVSHF